MKLIPSSKKLFYVLIICFALIFSFSSVLNQYVNIRSHNLNVMEAITECGDHNFSQETAELCTEIMKSQFMFRNIGSSLSGMDAYDKAKE